MKVLLFGAGDCYQKYKKWFDDVEIKGILDNDTERTGTLLDGKRIMLPSEGVREDYDCIYILSVYEEEIRKQLMDLGVSENKIFHYFDISTQLKTSRKQIQRYGHFSGNETILVLFYDLNCNGASTALLNAVKVIKSIGKEVVAASMNDGVLRKELLKLQIPIIIDVNMQTAVFDELEWAKDFALVFCNTINFYRMISKRNTDISFIWWLHEPEIFYAGIKKDIFQHISARNLHVYAAGRIAADAYRKLRPDDEIKILLYGLPDHGQSSEYLEREEQITSFAVIGNLQEYKAQDVFIEAVRMLAPAVRKRAEFNIVGGNNKSRYAAVLHQKAALVPEIKFWGMLEYESVHKFLDRTDVLICPSRQDTMPTVVAEAMMHSVVCILSDAVGTVSFVQNGKSGIIFECDNVRQLADEMEKCINRKYDLQKMGMKAREVYETYFSMDVFKKCITEQIGLYDAANKRI